MAVDAKGVWLCMKYAIPCMLKNGGGCIVNISSNQGLYANRANFEYVAAKHAVVEWITAGMESGSMASAPPLTIPT